MNNSISSPAHLLHDLKSTVELLIQFRGDSLTSKYGAIERLRSRIFAILCHQLKQNNNDPYEQLWFIIVRLNTNSQRYIHLLQDIYHKENIRHSVEQWIDQSMINQCLSNQLSSIETDEDLLGQYYHRHAFLCIPEFYQAFLLCLRTIERSDPSLLMHIDPKLYCVGFRNTTIEQNGSDLRFSSSVESKTLMKPGSMTVKERLEQDENQNTFHSRTHKRIHSDPIFSVKSIGRDCQLQMSLSPLAISREMSSFNPLETSDCFGSSSNVSEGNLLFEAEQSISSKSASEQSNLTIENCRSSEITFNDELDNHQRFPCLSANDETMTSTNSTSPIEQSLDMANQYELRPRFPHSSLFWPRRGQTLDNYIRESDLRTRTDVEKENAHLYFSEAIIAAIEQIKFTRQCQQQFGQSWSSSIANLISPCETRHSSSSPSCSTSPSIQQYIPCNPNLSLSLNPMGKKSIEDQSIELTRSVVESEIPPSTFELSTRTTTLNNSNVEDSSAESIALTLMEIWKNYQVPAATELLWMIPHDTDLPQALLPMPVGIHVDPSEDSLTTNDGRKISCRGNEQWAPPREQLIFRIHPSSNRDAQLKDQRYLCAGCGRRVEKVHISSYRYCEYTDKYFCRSCHWNKRTFLPSYIINRWNFSTNHYVSNFAFNYLNRIRDEPIFNLHDLNQKLFEKNRKLRLVDDYRWSLFYLQQYILHCRLADEKGDQAALKKLSTHLYINPYVYSIEDLFQTKSGELLKVLDPVVTRSRQHVLKCPICSGQGHICQICRNGDDVIFPFDLETTSVCQVCQSCFHVTCHENQNFSCPKCPRQKNRKSLIVSNRSTTPTNSTATDDRTAEQHDG